MKKILYFFIFATIGSLFFSCKPIDLTADFKDITISYGILNDKDSLHYIKVYRGFLTDENAYSAAQNPDNIYYPVDSIEVRLEEYKNGKISRSAILDTTTIYDKTAGDFQYPNQMLYFSDWKLDKNATYRLVINRKNSNTEVYAETIMIGDFTIQRPMQTWNMNLNKESLIRFTQGENAAMYDIYLTFYYIEVDNNTGAIEHKQISRKLNGDYIRATTSSDLSYSGFTPNTFFTTFIQTLDTNANVTRYIDAIDNQPFKCLRLTVWAGSKEYLTYREAASPSSSIVQNRTEYTNFISDDNSALGLFASRNYSKLDLQLSPTEHNEDTLVNSKLTKHLHFDYYRNSPLYIE